MATVLGNCNIKQKQCHCFWRSPQGKRLLTVSLSLGEERGNRTIKMPHISLFLWKFGCFALRNAPWIIASLWFISRFLKKLMLVSVASVLTALMKKSVFEILPPPFQKRLFKKNCPYVFYLIDFCSYVHYSFPASYFGFNFLPSLLKLKFRLLIWERCFSYRRKVLREVFFL